MRVQSVSTPVSPPTRAEVPPSEGTRVAAVPEGEVKDWTVLVYNAGQADEGLMCTRNLLDLEKVGSDQNTHVVCMNYRSAWWPERFGKFHEYLGARTYYVTRQEQPASPGWVPADGENLYRLATTSPARIGSPEIAPRQDEVQMGDVETFRKFVLENAKRFPARHYCIIMGGHGAGFAGQAMMRNPDGRIQNEDIGKVLQEVSAQIGHKVDVVNLNTCYGAGLEVFHPLREGARTAVSSEGTVFGGTQPLGSVLADLQQDLKAGRSVDGSELARKFVQHSRHQAATNLNTATLSAVDLERIDGVADAVAHLHRTLIDQKIEPKLLADLMESSLRLEYSGVPRTVYLNDVGSFARAVGEKVDNQAVRDAAGQVVESLESCLLDEEHAYEAKENPTTLAFKTLLGKQDQVLDGMSGLSIHYDNDVNARGSRLFQLKDQALAKKIEIAEFLKYVSQPADERRAAKFEVQRQLEQMTYKKRIFEYKASKAINVPFAVPVAKRVVKTGAMIGAGMALDRMGLPSSQFWGAYFGYQGAKQVVQAARQAAPVVFQDGPTTTRQKLQLVDNLADGTMGACLGTLGLNLLGLVPREALYAAVGVAMAARVGRYVGKVVSNQADHEAYKLARASEQPAEASLAGPA